ncbi:MAG: hypothetical protein J3K34DRAFT_522072 [Monoraphidium minutum]|nr:MAG: hypothetical protein J3K34DRAFT_522072 [Monoraphidium minutum]
MRFEVVAVVMVLLAAGGASAQGPSLCMSALEALNITVTGTTVDAAAMLAGVSSEILTQVMSFHILADGIRTINSFRRRTVVTTRLGAGRDGSLTVVKPRRNSIVRMEVRHRTIDADDDPSDRERVETEDSDVAVPDRTLNGTPYAAGTSSHIVHVIDDVMVPVAAGPALRLVRWNNIAGKRKL